MAASRPGSLTKQLHTCRWILIFQFLINAAGIALALAGPARLLVKARGALTAFLQMVTTLTMMALYSELGAYVW